MNCLFHEQRIYIHLNIISRKLGLVMHYRRRNKMNIF